DEGIDITDNDITVRNCYIGLDVDGETVQGNNQNPDTGNFDRHAGIVVSDNNSLITNNVISGNQRAGIVVGNADGSVNATGLTNGNDITDNIIGLAASDSSTAKGNGGSGIRIEDGTNNTIGGVGQDFLGNDVSLGNIVSANGSAGIVVESNGNLLRNNFVGTTFDGDSGRGNGTDGIALSGDNNTVDAEGFFLFPFVTVISGNDKQGIDVGGSNNSADGTTIEDAIIGLNSAADKKLPNGDGTASGGIVCRRSTGTSTSDITKVRNNVVAGNNGEGVRITDECYGWDLIDNFIGTNRNLASGLGNSVDGIQATANLPTLAVSIFDENVIVANGQDGIEIAGSFYDVTDNYIGVAPDGTKLGNGRHGILLDGTAGTAVEGVFIGKTNNSLGDGSVAGTSTPTGEGNVIGANGADGILMQGDAANNVFEENYIGTTPEDANVGNGGTADDGIRIVGDGSSSTGHVIGYEYGASFSSPDPSDGGQGNVIAYNGGDGISLGSSESSTDVRGVSVRGNVTYQNGGDTPQLGIDLGNSGVTSNDGGDTDSGPNGLQNSPEVTSVSHDDSNNEVTIEYEINTNDTGSNYPLRVDFYVADTESSGEGKRYLGSQDYRAANQTNQIIFNLDNYSGVSSSDYFVATATDANGNTSEFFGPPGEQLPVELASFDGTQTGPKAVELTWTTASEQNNAGFRVQHRPVESDRRSGSTASGSKGAWEEIGYVESNASGGTTTETKTYRFTVDDLTAGTHEFRLKQVDLSGTTHPHEPTTVELRMEKALRLSSPAPNPVRGGTAEVSFAVRRQAKTTIRLYNTLGQQVKTVYRGTPTAGESTTARLKAHDLPSGVYFLRLKTGDRSKTRRLAIIQ
ncbi:MAG: T9SS type A sorting domain-containing protein, partial [Salinibacter sp.]|uniref:T9SS type A sorting domain-containing protein n=1 Tax=Salinibacter sp. TaxID=2065818 RepID=UPI0035D4B538